LSTPEKFGERILQHGDELFQLLRHANEEVTVDKVVLRLFQRPCIPRFPEEKATERTNVFC
jgi:hypothetical protein